MNNRVNDLSSTVKQLRKEAGITQKQLAEYSGVGLALVRKIEQGGITMRVDKVNRVLALFDYALVALPAVDNS
ncbi:MAG: helix-turn-helix transcriptional regulator [Candidatus Sabulitectum sp.]|nr:helix-turn-helix transcriptional regulator [Candidatus Sabulitectum sp.]